MVEPFKAQEIEVSAGKSIEMVDPLKQRTRGLPEFREIGLLPRKLSSEMKVTMPKKDVGAWVKALANRDRTLELHARPTMRFQVAQS
jgi:hypothetical protein